MRRKFWQYVHYKLEAAWHWVYLHKLADPESLPNPAPVNYQYTYTYLCGKTGITSLPQP